MIKQKIKILFGLFIGVIILFSSLTTTFAQEEKKSLKLEFTIIPLKFLSLKMGKLAAYSQIFSITLRKKKTGN